MSSQPFTNKVIALTGSASGIGLETAKLLASRGARLSLADIQEDKLKELQAQLESEYYVDVITTKVDVRKFGEVEAWINKTIDNFGKLDGSANLAGVAPESIGLKGIVEQDLDEWEFVLGVNLTGTMNSLKAQLKVMANNGSIVNASSIRGLTGAAKNASYSSAKHGIIGLTRTAAKEVGGKGIRVNAICPGRISTPMLKTAENSIGLHLQPGSANYPPIALGRDGEAKEVAQLVAFLLSDESTYISGADISIDGGWRC
ncbi:Bcaba4 [Botrytis cinerea B05.10]|uniref:Short-chain dehydrogenase/reductase aba4 n=1 Tax=Botryotinia fuckeliana (strain B05.10) TaxID=332648 RepID=ABA4_BOTFB|nr:Bcaba4 [Botrytis cinerea B05.10]A0A384JQF5.1 RecName: Full=Short-chain dehydrogenase/reductase aba4; AltName: Full=Abscisic acid biosynthesis cluster protein 4 [Botrytis cinerea B05.10]ATZ52740.1 Bcaba4 [Botrytis cinerea B05.10]